MEQTEKLAQGVFVGESDTEVRLVKGLEVCDIVGGRSGQLHGLQPGTKAISAHLPLRAGNSTPSGRALDCSALCSDSHQKRRTLSSEEESQKQGERGIDENRSNPLTKDRTLWI